MNMISMFRLPIVILFALTLAACGGESTNSSGNNSGSGNTTTTTTSGGNTNPNPGSGTGSAMLSWTAPTLNTDGSALTDLAGYKIYYGTSSRSYTQSITINNVGIVDYLVENLPAGTWYFAISAFNSTGDESGKSGEVVKNI